MSKLRVDQVETLDGLSTKNVSTLVDNINTVEVSTSTGTQPMSEALDARAAVESTIIKVNSISDMTSLDVSDFVDGQQISVLSRNSPTFPSTTFYGGGLFIWDSGSTATTDSGVVFAHDTASGRFVRSDVDGELKLSWFATGNTATEQTQAMQDAAEYHNLNRVGKILCDLPEVEFNSTIDLSLNGRESGGVDVVENLIIDFNKATVDVRNLNDVLFSYGRCFRLTVKDAHIEGESSNQGFVFIKDNPLDANDDGLEKGRHLIIKDVFAERIGTFCDIGATRNIEFSGHRIWTCWYGYRFYGVVNQVNLRGNSVFAFNSCLDVYHTSTASGVGLTEGIYGFGNTFELLAGGDAQVQAAMKFTNGQDHTFVSNWIGNSNATSTDGDGYVDTYLVHAVRDPSDDTNMTSCPTLIGNRFTGVGILVNESQGSSTRFNNYSISNNKIRLRNSNNLPLRYICRLLGRTQGVTFSGNAIIVSESSLETGGCRFELMNGISVTGNNISTEEFAEVRSCLYFDTCEDAVEAGNSLPGASTDSKILAFTTDTTRMHSGYSITP